MRFVATLLSTILFMLWTGQPARAVSQLFVNDFDLEQISCYPTYYNEGTPPEDWRVEIAALEGTILETSPVYTLNDFYNEFSVKYEGEVFLKIILYSCREDGHGIGGEILVRVIDDDNAHFLYEKEVEVTLPDSFCQWNRCTEKKAP